MKHTWISVEQGDISKRKYKEMEINEDRYKRVYSNMKNGFGKQKVHLLQGSFTVEASFIVPVIIFGIIALVWVVFYLRNSVKIMTTADKMMFTLEENAARHKYEGGLEDELYGDKGAFYGAVTSKATVKRNGRNIEVNVEVIHNLPEKGILGYILSGIRKLEAERQEKLHDPAETARIVKAAGELIGDIKQLIKKNDENKSS